LQKILLVHGAWADGSSWAKVIVRLQAQAFDVVSVQIPLTSFEDDVNTVQRALGIEEGPLLLVAHSYGGGVITEAGNSPKVAGLVYIAAFAPDTGESMESLLATAPPTAVGAEVRPDAQGFLKVTAAGMAREVGPDLPDSEAKLLFATQTPTSFTCISGAVTSPAWKTRPNWFLIVTGDRIIPTVLQARMSEKIKAATKSVDASHVVLVSRPGDVAEFIMQAATVSLNSSFE
jgi:pimeloyl-ACP methyl ester carboxylesterase